MSQSRNHGPLFWIGSLVALLAALGWMAWFLGEGPRATVESSGSLAPVTAADEQASQRGNPVLPSTDRSAEASPTSPDSPPELHPTAAVSQTLLPSGATPGTPGVIAGVVVGAEDGLPLNRFVLRLHRGADPSGADWGLAEIQRVRSASGAFNLGQRPPGLYSLRVTAPGHVPMDALGLVVPSSEKLTLALSVGAVMSGHIRDVYGRDAADILVELRAAPGSELPTSGFVRRAQTDDTGRYMFTNVKPGNWQASVPDPHGGPEPLGVSPVWSAGTDSRGVWDATLEAEVTLEVAVFSGGEPLGRGIKVRLTSAKGQAIQRRVRGGKARFERLAPASYDLVIQRSGGAVAWEEEIVVSGSAEVDVRRFHIPLVVEPLAGDG